MTGEQIITRLRSTLSRGMPLPGAGQTAIRHRRLMELGRENLSLARLAEAHWDAVAILAEAGREPEPAAIYGVWASEIPGQELTLASRNGSLTISGTKRFCTGAGLIDRALVTVGCPDSQLVDVDLGRNAGTICFDSSSWVTEAFAETRTATTTFTAAPLAPEQLVGAANWYVQRPGFWHGACGPAACWAGGATGLIDYALAQERNDPHTLAHLGAMQASVWALHCYLDLAGEEIDRAQDDALAAQRRALIVRHLVEQVCTDVLRRLPRAYGPHPLAMNEDISRRYQELDLYLRQSHAERDLESLGRSLKGVPRFSV
jgi:alkylation response protein AidB-like acyl-CoA dehydrogenase